MNVVDENSDAGMPGGIQLFANVNSLDTLLGDVRALIPAVALKGKSINPDIDVKVAGIDFHINQVNITDITIATSSMAFVGDSNTVRTILSDINVKLAVDVGASSIFPIALDVTEVELKNVTIQLDLATSTEDELKWQVQENLILSIEDFSCTVKEKFWQSKLDALKPEFRSAIDYTLGLATGVVKGLIDVFNYELANETATTFVFDISPLGVDQAMPFNLTMSRAPEFNNLKGEIILHIDGDFDGKDMREYVPEFQNWIDYNSM